VEGQFFPEQILPTPVAFLDDGFLDRVQALEPDAMVADVSALWGILTARLLEVPLITSCSCTLFESLEPAFGYLREKSFSSKSAEWIRQRYGIEYDPMCSYMNESGFTIAFSLPELQPASRRSCATVHFFGAALSADIDRDLETASAEDRRLGGGKSVICFIEKARQSRPDKKLIYCTLGTVVGQEPWTLSGKKDGDMVADFYEQVISVLGDKEDYSVVISLGCNRKVEGMSKNPRNFFMTQCVPQKVVLKMVDLFITHCGNNGVHEAYFLGCPMLCVPVFGDQRQNADTIERVGAGVQIRSPFAPNPSPNLDHVTADALKSKLEEVFINKEYIRASCKKIEESMRRRHVYFHSEGMSEMEAFIEKEIKRVQNNTR